MRALIVGVLGTLAVTALVAYRWRERAGPDPPPGIPAVALSPPWPAASPPSQAVPAQSYGVQPSPEQPRGDFAEVAALNLSQLRTGLTVREFSQFHPGEQPRPTSRANDPDLRFRGSCALAVAKIPLYSGPRLERVAAFYVPPIPSPVVPPAAKDPAEMVGDCVLGAIYVSVPVPDANEAERMSATVMIALSKQFGDVQRPPKDPNFNPGWQNRMQWKQGDITVHAGYDPYRIGANDVASFRVYAYSAPVLESERKLPPWWQLQITLRPKESVNFEFAVKTAALDPAATIAISESYRRAAEAAVKARPADASAATNQYAASANQAAGVLRQWLQASDDLPPQRRAAAFLAAYYLVRAAERQYGQDPRIVRLFEKEGSRYWKPTAYQDEDSLGRWLGIAFSLDPEGPVGDTIVLEQMTQACYFDGLYAAGGPLLEHVISHGESYLTRKHDPADTALAAFLLASAYQDLVDIASGRLEEIDPAPYKGRLPEARTKALQHYSAAINFDPNSTIATISWRETWNLLANFPSRNFHYACPTGD